MGSLSKRDERLVKQLLKRAERLESEAEYQQLPRHAHSMRNSARINREHAQKISEGVLIDGL